MAGAKGEPRNTKHGAQPTLCATWDAKQWREHWRSAGPFEVVI